VTAGSTFSPIATTTLGSATSSVTFNSFSGYTDLVLVFNGTVASGSGSSLSIQFNGDTGSNYSETILAGSGTAAGSGRDSNLAFSVVGTIYTTDNNAIVNVMNYSNATTYKTIISRSNNAANSVRAFVSLWRSTAAITSMVIKADNGAVNFATGCTFTLYGISAA
jgi:hypothetical protein